MTRPATAAHDFQACTARQAAAGTLPALTSCRADALSHVSKGVGVQAMVRSPHGIVIYTGTSYGHGERSRVSCCDLEHVARDARRFAF